MRIGIDARELLGRPTGVGRYVGELLNQWAQMATEGGFSHEVVLYTPAVLPDAFAPILTALQSNPRVVPGASGTWWEQVQLPAAARTDRLDVFFAPAYTSPLRMQMPVVQTIHDLSYMAHPEWFAFRERVRRTWLTRASARRARFVLTVSDFSATEIANRLGIAPDRIRTIPHGMTPPGGGPASRSEWPPFAEREPLVLYVGSIFNRRRVPELIEAFAMVARDVAGARLEIVGENRTHPHQDLEGLCQTLGIADRVALRAYVSDTELVRLYGTARAFAFLSEYEGFGLTPLEGLSCGIPVVVLDTPVARETCGAAAAYVRPGAPRTVADCLTRWLTDPSAHAAALEAAPGVLARYQWSGTAVATLEVLLMAAGQGR
jgi:glycosyltransferase involved in cell wall biosynthesis